MIDHARGRFAHHVCRTRYADLPVAARQSGCEGQRSTRTDYFLGDGIADRCGASTDTSGWGVGSSARQPEISLKAILLVLNPATETPAERCAPQVHLFFYGILGLIRSRLQ